MVIKNMKRAKNLPGWKTKAFFSVETKNFIIHNCRLVLADTGRLIAHLPYEQHPEGGRIVYGGPVIEFKDLDYLEAVTEAAVKAYDALR